MKNNRIVTSFNKVNLPIDREDALLARILMEADVERASLEKEQEMNTRNRDNDKQGANPPSRQYRMPKKRKALLIAIVAILLLLSACAAYAIYWSSTQRAKEYSQSEQAVDDRQALAEQFAEQSIAGTTFYGVIEGTAEVDGIALELVGASYWPNDDPPEMHIAFNAVDAKTGDDRRLYDFDYVLTAGGKAYPAYAPMDQAEPRKPAIARADSMAPDGSEYEIWFRIADQKIADGMPMTLSATLYAYDDAGNRGETLGSFTLDFIYEIPTEQIEAERARLVEEALLGLDTQAKEQADTIAALPDEMTPLNITQDEYTFVDARVTQEGFLLGDRVVTRGADFPKTYMDGLELYGEGISSIFTPDETRQRLDIAWEVAYYGTSEAVTLYPWYAPLEELPETVLFAVLRDAGSKERRKGGMEEEMITYTWEKVELLLRINPRTGEITLPKDDAERQAWREETLRLAADGRNERHELTLNPNRELQQINGVSASLYTLDYDARSREMMLTCFANGIYYFPELASSPPVVYIDGVLQTTKESSEDAPFSQAEAEAWVERNGGWEPRNNCPSDATILLDKRAFFLPETFTLRVVWDVYDRNEKWERIHVGTFDFTKTVSKSDIAPWDSL